MRLVFADTLLRLAAKDKRICLITPDMGYGILDKFKASFPERYFNLGITEQNCISVAAGMAICGMKPYVYSIIPFATQRCLEQIRVDVSYMNLDVKIVGVGAGFEYGAAGATHHGTEDVAMMRALPNMIVLAPGDKYEIEKLTRLSYQTQCPTYLRIGRHSHENMNQDDALCIGKGSVLRNGFGIALIATGNMLPVAYDCAVKLQKYDKNVTLVSMHTVKPVDTELIVKLCMEHTTLITLEEHTIIGGLGSAIAEIVADNGLNVKLIRLGINDCFSHIVGSAAYIRRKFNLDEESIVKTINEHYN